jgi:hypothetical protein
MKRFIITSIAVLFLLFNCSNNSLQSGANTNQSKIPRTDTKNTNTMNNSRNFTYSSSFTNSRNQNSFQQQITAISLSIDALKTPHFLSIKATDSTQLVGQIAVEGVAIKRFHNSQISFDLSPYLSKGNNTIEISGNYQPSSSSVLIEFSGSGTRVTQQISGNGILRQTLIFNVR